MVSTCLKSPYGHAKLGKRATLAHASSLFKTKVTSTQTTQAPTQGPTRREAATETPPSSPSAGTLRTAFLTGTALAQCLPLYLGAAGGRKPAAGEAPAQWSALTSQEAPLHKT